MLPQDEQSVVASAARHAEAAGAALEIILEKGRGPNRDRGRTGDAGAQAGSFSHNQNTPLAAAVYRPEVLILPWLLVPSDQVKAGCCDRALPN